MQTVNLFQLTRITDHSIFAQYEQQLSHRKELLVPKVEEILTLQALVNLIIAANGNISDSLRLLDFFFYSFTIPKISKEFDLLRIGSNYIIDIELKSQSTYEKILKQLKQNKYYLNSLCRPVQLYAFDMDSNQLYILTEGNALEVVTTSYLYAALKDQIGLYQNDIENLFKPSDFLISPMNTPERFLRSEYFLSSQQEEIAKDFLREIQKPDTFYFGVTGGPGTGKTLLIYDLAVKLSVLGKCCIIHCGIIPEGLDYLNKALTNIDIVGAKEIKNGFPFESYRFLLLDESHRFYSSQYDLLIEQTKDKRITTIFSYDENQVLSQSEQRAEIAKKIEGISGCKTYRLTNKIRTNKELASFIERLRDLHSHNIVNDYSSVTLVYAKDTSEASLLLENFTQNGYTFINYTSSSYYPTTFDCYNAFCQGRNTHTVIGQEFEKVVMILDRTFAYDQDGKLRAIVHPNPNYLYRQLLFQGISRVREKLAIIVVDNPDVFAKVLSILE